MAPASVPRSARVDQSRSPDQYIWKKTFECAAVTSSIDLLASELRPIAVSAAAARATHLAVRVHGLHTGGEMSTGKGRPGP